MEEETGTYFIGMCLEQEDDDEVIFPLIFHTKNYKEVLTLVKCIAPGDPRKRVMYADVSKLF